MNMRFRARLRAILRVFYALARHTAILQKLEITDGPIKTTITNGVKGEMPAFGSKQI
jgi:hypothetical protein